MSDATQQGLQLSHGIAVGVGMAILGVGRILWNALQGSLRRELDTKNDQIAERDQRIAVLMAEKDRLEATVEKLGEDKDRLREAFHSLEVRAAGMVAGILRDPNVPDALVEDCPTGVYNTAQLIVGKPERARPPKGSAARLLQQGDERPVEEWTPTDTDKPPAPRPRAPSKPGR